VITIDQDRVIVTDAAGGREEHALNTPEAFSILSRVWLRSGWDNKYVYSFTWLGRPIIQLPEDMVRLQEVIYAVGADVIVETGVAHGGSLIFYASLCQAMGRGRVIGIDIEIRPHNRKAIEEHSLFPFITLIEGSSIDPAVVEALKNEIKPGETTLIFLDSCHTKQHVLAELAAYAPLVSEGSYIVAMDGIMGDVVGAPRTEADWSWNNPKQAALEFVKTADDFVIVEPPFLFNEGNISERVTYWPAAFIKRVPRARR
jgi:cephalosporin hydroxylase